MNPQSDQLPVGLIAQLAELCTGIAEVMTWTPTIAWIFFSVFIFTTAQVVIMSAMITYIVTDVILACWQDP